MKGPAGLMPNNLLKAIPTNMTISGMTIQPLDKKSNDPAHFNKKRMQ